MNYRDMIMKHQREVDEFPMFFAFNDTQFEEGLRELGVKKGDIVSINYGGFCRKSDKGAYDDMFKRQWEERKNYIKTDDNFVYDMFLTELADHEYVITYDAEPALSACGLFAEDLEEDARLNSIFCEALRDYLEQAEIM